MAFYLYTVGDLLPHSLVGEQRHGEAPGGARSGPPRGAVSWQLFPAVVIAAAVVIGSLVPVVVLVVVLVLDSGWSRVIWAVLLSMAVWQLLPRPERPSGRALPLDAVEYPALHQLAGDVAEAVAARAPTSVRVDTVFATSVIPVGYLGRAVLVIGLPQWTSLEREERVASVAHALVCVQVLRLPSGCLVRLADDILVRVSLLLTSSPDLKPHEWSISTSDSGLGMIGAGDELAGDRARREGAALVGAAGLSVVAGPVRAVRRVLRRAAAPAVTRACLRADHRAVNILGERAVESLLLSSLQVPRGLIEARGAALQRKDPFYAVAGAARPDRQELAARVVAAQASGERVGPAHGPTALRLQALHDTSGSAEVLARQPRTAGVEDELAALRERLARRFAEELIHGRG